MVQFLFRAVNLLRQAASFQCQKTTQSKRPLVPVTVQPLGLSEVSDAVVLVVSEETGALSLAYDSKLNYDLSLEEVRKILENLLEITSEAQVLEDTVDEHKTFA